MNSDDQALQPPPGGLFLLPALLQIGGLPGILGEGPSVLVVLTVTCGHFAPLGVAG